MKRVIAAGLTLALVMGTMEECEAPPRWAVIVTGMGKDGRADVVVEVDRKEYQKVNNTALPYLFKINLTKASRLEVEATRRGSGPIDCEIELVEGKDKRKTVSETSNKGDGVTVTCLTAK